VARPAVQRDGATATDGTRTRCTNEWKAVRSRRPGPCGLWLAAGQLRRRSWRALPVPAPPPPGSSTGPPPGVIGEDARVRYGGGVGARALPASIIPPAARGSGPAGRARGSLLCGRVRGERPRVALLVGAGACHPGALLTRLAALPVSGERARDGATYRRHRWIQDPRIRRAHAAYVRRESWPRRTYVAGAPPPGPRGARARGAGGNDRDARQHGTEQQ
jgi:hypothetical protein